MKSKQEIYEGILNQFVDPESYRAIFNTIFRTSNKNVATNGVVIITAPLYNAELPNYEENIKNVNFDKQFNIPIKIEKLKEVLNKIKTVDSYDTIETIEDCPACDGASEVNYEFHYGKTYTIIKDCPVCDGCGEITKKVKNTIPNGKKEYKKNSIVKILGLYVSPEYIQKLVEIAEELQQIEIKLVNITYSTILFTVEQLEIMMMTIKLNGVPADYSNLIYNLEVENEK